METTALEQSRFTTHEKITVGAVCVITLLAISYLGFSHRSPGIRAGAVGLLAGAVLIYPAKQATEKLRNQRTSSSLASTTTSHIGRNKAVAAGAIFLIVGGVILSATTRSALPTYVAFGVLGALASELAMHTLFPLVGKHAEYHSNEAVKMVRHIDKMYPKWAILILALAPVALTGFVYWQMRGHGTLWTVMGTLAGVGLTYGIHANKQKTLDTKNKPGITHEIQDYFGTHRIWFAAMSFAATLAILGLIYRRGLTIQLIPAAIGFTVGALLGDRRPETVAEGIADLKQNFASKKDETTDGDS